MICYHGSPVQISSFRPFSHFGTRKAAVERLKGLSKDYSSDGYGLNKGWMHEVELMINKPLKVFDHHYFSHTPLKIADMLYYEMSFITAHERSEIIKNREPALFMALKRRGYDSMVYINLHEDIHSLSYIISNADQAIIKKVETVRFGFNA